MEDSKTPAYAQPAYNWRQPNHINGENGKFLNVNLIKGLFVVQRDQKGIEHFDNVSLINSAT